MEGRRRSVWRLHTREAQGTHRPDDSLVGARGQGRGQVAMNAVDLFGQWLKVVGSLTIVVGRTPAQTARDNTLVFSLADARAAGAMAAELGDFLTSAFRTYSLLAARAGFQGWFYAWHDEVSGTIRCSVSGAATAMELPFACALEVHDNPTVVVEGALASPYASGIPAAELHDVEWSEPEQEASQHVLPVFVRRLIQSA
jgi:hypothetical protein